MIPSTGYELSIIIVSYNVSNLLRNCLNSIQKNVKDLEYQIIVVDNHSKDESLKMLREEFPSVELIENKKNIGFAAANNQGLIRAKGKYILFLNPDTVILNTAIQECLIEMKKEPSIGVLGLKILNPDLTLQRSCRRFPTIFSQVIILLKLHNFFPKMKAIKNYMMLDFSHNEKKIVDQVMGAFFLTKREVVEKIGQFDEGFKIWFEEVDFCQRIKNYGFHTLFFPFAKIIHYQGSSNEQIGEIKRQMIFNKSLLYYFKKHGQGFDRAILFILFPISLGIAFLIKLLGFFKLKPSKK